MGDVGLGLLRELGQLALAMLVGGATFLLIGSPLGVTGTGWVGRIERCLPMLWLVHVGAAAATVVARAVQVTRETALEASLDPGLVEAYAFGTHVGRVSMGRMAVAAAMVVPLGVLLLSPDRPARRRVGLVGLLVLACGVVALGPLAGHAAADETTVWLVPIHMAHVLAMSIWLGGLPFWVASVVDAMHGASLHRLRVVLGMFSRVATLCMFVLVASGTALAWAYLDTAGDLFGTRYGALLCSKVVLLTIVLVIANRMRADFLPALVGVRASEQLPSAARWVLMELMLAAAIAALGVAMGQTTPATHDQPLWPFGRRLSVEATWPAPGTATVVPIALVVAALAAVWLIAAWGRMALSTRMVLTAALIIGVGAALWKMSVPAYPATYQRSTVPYLAVSISQGMQQFTQRCTGCHGPGGLGDGPMATTLPKRPADLSEPHTALHTAGDMFWWITHGIPDSGMPGFSSQLDEQARWDVINFLRVFSEGFQARTLDTSIVPGGPWLGAPNFYFEDAYGKMRELKDYREHSNVLVVFLPNGAAAAARVRKLVGWSEALHRERTEILLISAEPSAQTGMFVISNGEREIRQTYDLLSRTITNRGDGRRLGLDRDHMEFLIDRFGYIRARWVPGESTADWQQLAGLLEELKSLNREPRIRPPPDGHVH